MREDQSGFDYIASNVDDLMIAAVDVDETVTFLKQEFMRHSLTLVRPYFDSQGRWRRLGLNNQALPQTVSRECEEHHCLGETFKTVNSYQSHLASRKLR